MRGQKNDINVRGAFLHMVADTLVSVGVVVSGIIITYTGWNIVDPVVSILISFVILASTWRLLSESLKLSLDGMPEGIDLSRTIAEMCAAEHVKEVHHVHIWAISTTENAPHGTRRRRRHRADGESEACPQAAPASGRHTACDA